MLDPGNNSFERAEPSMPRVNHEGVAASFNFADHRAYFHELRKDLDIIFRQRFECGLHENLTIYSSLKLSPFEDAKCIDSITTFLIDGGFLTSRDAAQSVAEVQVKSSFPPFPADEHTLFNLPSEISDSSITREAFLGSSAILLETREILLANNYSIPDLDTARTILQSVGRSLHKNGCLILYSLLTDLDIAIEDLHDPGLVENNRVINQVFDSWEVLTQKRDPLLKNHAGGAFLDLIVRDVVARCAAAGIYDHGALESSDTPHLRAQSWINGRDQSVTYRIAQWLPVANIFYDLTREQVMFLHKFCKASPDKLESALQMGMLLQETNPDDATLHRLQTLNGKYSRTKAFPVVRFLLTDPERIQCIRKAGDSLVAQTFRILETYAQEDLLIDGSKSAGSYLNAVFDNENQQIRKNAISLMASLDKILIDRNAQKLFLLFGTDPNAPLIAEYYFKKEISTTEADLFLETCISKRGHCDTKELVKTWKKLAKSAPEICQNADADQIFVALQQFGLSFAQKAHPEPVAEFKDRIEAETPQLIAQDSIATPEWFQTYCSTAHTVRGERLSQEELIEVSAIAASINGWDALQTASLAPQYVFNAFCRDVIEAYRSDCTLLKVMLQNSRLYNRLLILIEEGNTRCRTNFTSFSSDVRNPFGALARILVRDGENVDTTYLFEYQYTPQFDSQIQNRNFSKVILVGYEMGGYQPPQGQEFGFSVIGMEPEEAARKSNFFGEDTLVILLTKILPHSEGGAIQKHPGQAEVKLLHERSKARISGTLAYLSTLPTGSD